MGDANAKKEHLSYSQLDNATLEMWAQSLNLSRASAKWNGKHRILTIQPILFPVFDKTFTGSQGPFWWILQMCMALAALFAV